MDANAHAAKAVFLGQEQPGDHLRMFSFPACGSAVLTVGGDVEDGLAIDRQFRLNLEGFLQQLLAACEVFASGKPRKGADARIEYVGWVEGVFHRLVREIRGTSWRRHFFVLVARQETT